MPNKTHQRKLIFISHFFSFFKRFSDAGYRRPIIIASTRAPLSIVWRTSVFGGKTRRAFAVLMLSRRLLIWLPVLMACGIGSSGCHVRRALWYSGRGSRWILSAIWNQYVFSFSILPLRLWLLELIKFLGNKTFRVESQRHVPKLEGRERVRENSSYPMNLVSRRDNCGMWRDNHLYFWCAHTVTPRTTSCITLENQCCLW